MPENVAKIRNYSNPSRIWVDIKPQIIAKISNYSNPHESVWIPSPKISLKSVTTQILMNLGGYQAENIAKISNY